MDNVTLDEIDAFRKFNRFYTSFLGALRQDYLQSGFSLAEVRVLYEIHAAPGCAARDALDATGLDKGYLSRILARLGREKLIEKRGAEQDGRVKLLHLTEKGSSLIEALQTKARAQAEEALCALSAPLRQDLLASMGRIMEILPSLEPDELGLACGEQAQE